MALSFSTLLVVVVAVSGCTAVANATTINFVNRCGYSINLVKTENGRNSVKECDLGAGGGSCRKSYSSNGMNFKHGWGGQGITLAEFSFNSWQGMDFYDLSVINGFNVPMQIESSTGGPTVTCHHQGCSDAYQYPKDDTKTKGTGTGGTFTVKFCP
ncbi:hypothetical protein BV898_11077 [Hypsibius exemplaris]|uniref:Osmotin, thaumatin-like protein n=1 Tax=Hypsibius exemplaris TaxID=2072580 RepID=A0A1W0WHU7_HYPEX|nr:hypothetical protein BV898_11077 [Hypsibius exemplaris]